MGSSIRFQTSRVVDQSAALMTASSVITLQQMSGETSDLHMYIITSALMKRLINLPPGRQVYKASLSFRYHLMQEFQIARPQDD